MEAIYIQSIPKYDMRSFDQTIDDFYRAETQLNCASITERITFFSQKFLGKEYLVGALGEGYDGRFDQNPLYRFDAFDCLTYVNTIIAFTISNDLHSFKRNMIRLNYYHSEPRYVYRHHFMSADWNAENVRAGIIKDVTDTILDKQKHKLVQQAEAFIDRPNWFGHRQFSDIKLIKPVKKSEAEVLLKELHQLAPLLTPTRATISYIPIEAFFDDDLKPQQEIFDQIPDGAIIEIVRPNWNLSEKIGTNLHVSHVGFGIRQEGVLLYRQASSVEKCVADVPLETYLYRRINSPTIKGINIHVVCEDVISH